MWSALLEPKLALLAGTATHLRGFFQELAHFSLHRGQGNVLWCDGSHGFNPHEFGEVNLIQGFAAEDGAERMLIRRCMTPFQWYSCLSRFLPEKIAAGPTDLVIVNPFDHLWSTDELSDWEQEDYVRFIVPHLKSMAEEHRVPILLGVDMNRWWRTHSTLAQVTQEGAAVRWNVQAVDARWRAVREDGLVLDPMLRNRITLMDFLEEAPLTVPATTRRGRAKPERRHRTKIVHSGRRL